MRIFLMTPVGVVVTTRGRERETGLTTQGILDKACLTSGVKIIPNLPFRIRLLEADYSAQVECEVTCSGQTGRDGKG